MRTITTFSEGLDHPESVKCHPDGSFYAGGEAGQIYRIPANGGPPVEIANNGGFTLGLAIHPSGDWLAVCDLVHQCVWRLELATKVLSRLSSGTPDAPFRIPNHADFDAAGNLYVTDSGGFNEVSGVIYRIHPDGSTRLWHEGPFNFTNGISIAPDGASLLVACTWLPGIEEIAIQPDGEPGARRTLLRIERTRPDSVLHGPDGWIYIACYTPSKIFRCATDGSALEVFAEDWEDHALCHPTGICIRDRALYAANLGRWHIAKIDLGDAGPGRPDGPKPDPLL